MQKGCCVYVCKFDVYWRHICCNILSSMSANQGRNEVRCHPGQEASLAPPCSNLRSFGSKPTVLKKYLWHRLDISAPPAVIRRPHIGLAPWKVCPPCLLLNGLPKNLCLWRTVVLYNVCTPRQPWITNLQFLSH